MKTKKKSSSKRNKRNKRIKDPPFSDKLSKASDATQGLIDYHYQYYNNITDYIEYLCDTNKTLNKKICLLENPQDSTLLLDQTDYQKGITVMYIKKNDFISFIKECINDKKVKLIPIVLEIVTNKKDHANILIIDVKNKRIEIFEPHSKRSEYSTLDHIKKGYIKKKKAIERFFKSFIDYKVVDVVEVLKKDTLQAKYDSNSGACITWSLLYFHYRALNPTISYKRLIRYIDKKINLEKLLKYAKHVEDKLKSI